MSWSDLPTETERRVRREPGPRLTPHATTVPDSAERASRQQRTGAPARHRVTGRRAALALGLWCGLGALTLASGCGFRPVYGPAGSGAALDGATVVAQGGGPNDFTLARALQDRLGPPGNAPRFRLATILSIRAEQVAVTTAQSTNRFNLVGTVDYVLTDIRTGATVRDGRIDGFNSYSAIGTSLATRTARADATDRLMVILADRVMADLLSTPALLDGPAP